MTSCAAATATFVDSGGGAGVVLIDLDGGGMVDPMAPGGYSGYEMAIDVFGLTGTLDNSNFLIH
jgi:hypothetical protein